MMGLFSMSPQAQRQKDKDNRPMGEIPSGVPSVAGNNSRQASGTSGKLSSSIHPSSTLVQVRVGNNTGGV